MTEYYEVLNRPKFSKFPDFKLKVDAILLDIESHASVFYPKERIDMIKDADDNMLLELALECGADFLVTGNTNDFTITEFNKTRIVSPRDYWEFYKPK
jgi:putative PIN family toxin of toxin-antitoxin system